MTHETPETASTPAEPGGPPAARHDPTSRHLHGETVVDEFHWMRDRDDLAVREHLEAENAYTRARLAHTESLQARLFDEIKSRIQETDRSVAVHKDGWWYWSETEAGLQYRRFLRARSEPESDISVEAHGNMVLDANALAGDSPYFALGAFEVSPNHALLAYSVDFDGDELYTMRFRDLATGADLDDEIPGTYYSTAWAMDSATIYYTMPDAAMRPYQIRRHRIGTQVARDEVVYQEDDARFFVGVERTRSDTFIVIASGSKTTDEVHLVDAHDPAAGPRVVWPRRDAVEYTVDHHPGDHLDDHHDAGRGRPGGTLYIVTNDTAPNGKLVAAPVSDPMSATDVIAHDPAVKIEEAEVFARHIVVWGRKDGLTSASVLPVDTDTESPADSERAVFDLGFDEPGYTIAPGQNPTFDTDIVRFTYTSLTQPSTVYDHDMATGERITKKVQPVLGGYDPADYESVREWAEAPDGTRVPISLVRPRPATGADPAPAPLLLYGYGSYEASMDPAFSPLRLSLLERGFTFAIAHVRGGGEMGRPWYEAGKLAHKTNTFDDFIACAEHLIETGRTRPELLAIRGGSAGGMLIGATVNRRPDLFGAAVAEVPFVDVVNTMLDDTLPLTITEWEEWGNPNDADVYGYIRTYAPYENVRDQRYPPMLITAGLNDPRVQYWEPAKWAARLREHTTSDAPILLKCELDAGHAGPSGRYDVWKDEALVYAFVIDALGVTTSDA